MKNSLTGDYFREASKIVPTVLGIFFAFSLLVACIYFGNVLYAEPEIKLSDYIQIVVLIFVAGTMFVGIYVQVRNEDFNRSEVHLKNSLELIEKAKNILLRKGEITNNRISWVTAARLLIRAQRTASLISFDAHKLIYEAAHDYERHEFADFLTQNGKSLSAAFFCGIHYPDPDKKLGEQLFSAPSISGGKNWIPERIISVVYRFFQFPGNYEDPLEKSIGLSNREIERLSYFDQIGVCRYLAFRANFFAAGEEIFSKKNGCSSAVNADDIDLGKL